MTAADPARITTALELPPLTAPRVAAAAAARTCAVADVSRAMRETVAFLRNRSLTCAAKMTACRSVTVKLSGVRFVSSFQLNFHGSSPAFSAAARSTGLGMCRW